MLDFKPLVLEAKEDVEPFFFRYGEGSCQHSFVSSFCMKEKYGDCYAIQDGFLFILRAKRCTQKERVYLFPLGDIQDSSACSRAIDLIIDDAHSHGRLVRFETITENAKNFLSEHYPERFLVEEKRDNSEYIFSREKIAKFEGKEYEEKRWEIHKFQKEYKDRFEIKPLSSAHFDEIISFTKKWYENFSSPETQAQLFAEECALKFAFEHFDDLGLDGIVILVDNKIAAYAYGMSLNQTTYDGFMEKADRSYKYIYQMLNHSVAQYCKEGIEWLNWEEDLGHEGLRKMKLSYKPIALLKKYLVTEKDNNIE